MRPRAFTVVELLVVAAILAILAAIGLPHFQAAQMRSKVTRARADLRTIRVALEAYAVDASTYPVGAGGMGFSGALQQLVAPRRYLESIPRDIFFDGPSYLYFAAGAVTDAQRERFGYFVLASAGPDRKPDTSLANTLRYDPTNGVLSRGDIVRSSRD